MFSFDGEYRRRPQQNFGGASQVNNRDTLIKKAHEERQKRDETRRQNDKAKIIQSTIRSFIIRKTIKSTQRDNFDNYVKIYGLSSIGHLHYLLPRLLLFYDKRNGKDNERMIFLCQYLLRDTEHILLIAIGDQIWLYRIKKLLALSLDLLFLPEISLAIPIRMLEEYSSYDVCKKYLKTDIITKNYLDNIYNYLINKNYYKYVNRLIIDKIPELDDKTIIPPNHISDTILNMLIRPLKLVTNIDNELNKNILLSFAYHILSNEFCNGVKYFILPSLSCLNDFPFKMLINYLLVTYQQYINNIKLINNNSNNNNYNYNNENINNLKNKEQLFSSYILYSILTLDMIHLNNLDNHDFWNYINLISILSNNIKKLPTKIYKQIHDDDNNEDDDDDDESNENDYNSKNNNINLIEHHILLDIVLMLNEQNRSIIIVNKIEESLDNNNIIQSISQICHNLMTYDRLAVFEYKLLYTLAFKPNFIRSLWYTLIMPTEYQGISSPLALLSTGVNISKEVADKIIPMLATFCALFSQLIFTLHDTEFCQENIISASRNKMMPFKISEIIQISSSLKDICLGLVELAFPETRSNFNEHYRPVLISINSHLPDSKKVNKNIWPHLLKVCVNLLRQIYNRDLRYRFCPENHWIAQTLNLPLDKPTDLHLTRGRRGIRPFQPIKDFTREDLEEGPPLSIKQKRSITILKEIPFVVTFNTRVGILQGLLGADKLKSQGEVQGFLQGPSIQIKVRRSHLYEDTFDKLSLENEWNLRFRMRVQFVNENGLDEAGIDGGGIFKEFLSELIKRAFDPNLGFFKTTTDNKLYPNPGVAKIRDDYHRHYFFIGRILGKALYESILIELPLADFFLTKITGKSSDVDVHQLASLDPVLHKNLLLLKGYEGDVSDLELDFTVVRDELGETRIEELKPNGANIPVTNSNRIEYIQLMADFKMNKQIRQQCSAFRQGLSNVLSVEWFYMFSNRELQVLIAGAEIPVDINDLKKYTKYGGDYSLDHQTIIYFWDVLDNFSNIEKGQLLKFVTSCSRPPLFGFKDLDPPFCIQNAGDTDRLPTASTCMNLLKLPAFDNKDILREKLLYAIQSNAGFELS